MGRLEIKQQREKSMGKLNNKVAVVTGGSAGNTNLSLCGYLKTNQGVPLLRKHDKFWHPFCFSQFCPNVTQMSGEALCQ